MGKITIFLVANEELWWDGLAKLLLETEGIKLLGKSSNPEEAICQISQLEPDLILLEEAIPGYNCGEVAENISKLNLDAKILIITQPYKKMSFVSFFKARVRAFIDKNVSFENIISAIHQVANGTLVVMSPLTAETILTHSATFKESSTSSRQENNISLSKREMEILHLLSARGATNKEIAESLCVTENTIKAHLSRIFEKMRVRNRQQAAALAREKGFAG
jgi:DNA-binding NarL/FixJ family response regulator